MTNQRTVRIGRARGFSAIGWPEIWDSVTMFMSCTFCNGRLVRLRRNFARQMGGNCGFAESNSAENEFAELPFETGRMGVSKTGNPRKSRQGRHKHGVMREPE